VRLCALKVRPWGSIVLKGLTNCARAQDVHFRPSTLNRGSTRRARPAIFGGFLTFGRGAPPGGPRFTADLKPSHTMAAVNAMKQWDPDPC